MSKIYIPKEDIPGFFKLAHLKKEDLGNLLKVINQAPTDGSIIELREKLENKIPFIGILFNLYYLLFSHNFVTKEYIGILYSFYVDNMKGKKISEKTFNEKFIKILDDRSQLCIKIKSVVLRKEYEKVFVEARIFTDIRPIFPVNYEEEFFGSIITHQFKLKYLDGGKEKEIYINFNEEDIQELKSVFERAEKKQESLEKILGSDKKLNIIM